MDAKVKELDETFLARSGELSDKLSSKAREINETLGARAEEIAGALDGIGAFETNVVGRLNQVSGKISSADAWWSRPSARASPR